VQIADAVREAQMAQMITVTLEDDLDGGPADETVRFGIDSADYEIATGGPRRRPDSSPIS
jgi:hypothetical protein